MTYLPCTRCNGPAVILTEDEALCSRCAVKSLIEKTAASDEEGQPKRSPETKTPPSDGAAQPTVCNS